MAPWDCPAHCAPASVSASRVPHSPLRPRAGASAQRGVVAQLRSGVVTTTAAGDVGWKRRWGAFAWSPRRDHGSDRAAPRLSPNAAGGGSSHHDTPPWHSLVQMKYFIAKFGAARRHLSARVSRTRRRLRPRACCRPRRHRRVPTGPCAWRRRRARTPRTAFPRSRRRRRTSARRRRRTRHAAAPHDHRKLRGAREQHVVVGGLFLLLLLLPRARVSTSAEKFRRSRRRCPRRRHWRTRNLRARSSPSLTCSR